MRTRRTRAFLLLVLGTIAALPSATRADEPAPETELKEETVQRARTLFLEAASLARLGEWAAASARFASSAMLRAHAVTTYNQGYCERTVGNSTLARALFRKALAEHEASGQRELSTEILEATRVYLVELEHHIARVRVKIAPPGPAIAIDGRPLEPVAHAGAMIAGTREAGPGETPVTLEFELQIDPGEHEISLVWPGREAIRQRRQFMDGAELNLALEPESSARSERALSTRIPHALAPSTRVAEPRSPDLLYAALIGGAAGVVLGSVAGAIAVTSESDLEKACADKQCRGHAAGSLATARTWADIATVSFITGGLGLAGAGVLWLTSAPSDSPSSLTPWVGIASLGCSAQF